MNIEFDEGYKAYQDGKQLTDNPYLNVRCPFKQTDWRDGWNEAHYDTLNEKAADKAGEYDSPEP